MKVATILGTRPEIIRLSRVMAALDQYTDHLMIHTGQNFDYELNRIFFDDLGIRSPDRYLDAAGTTPAQTIGEIIARSDEVLAEIKPDAVLILGDTNSALSAISAKRRRIPVFHMEAGNRCFDDRVPEEINRRIVDHISDVNLPYSAISREYLLREGFPPDRVIKTGSPMYEVLHHYMERIKGSDILEKLGLTPDDYFVVSLHREENINDARQFAKAVVVLRSLVSTFGRRVIVSVHPRTRKVIESEGVEFPVEVELLKPLGFCDYVGLMLHSLATLSDSGTITEEASILNLPALNLRNAHERPEGMEEGAVMFTGLEWGRICEGLKILERQPRAATRLTRIVSDYQAPNVSEKVVRIIQSYTDFVNRVVWRSSQGI